MLLVTPGDPEGIGHEVTCKALRHFKKKQIDYCCVGSAEGFVKLGAKIERLKSIATARAAVKKGLIPVLIPPTPETRRLDTDFSLAGYQAGWSIQKAAELIRAGFAKALVTGPISKFNLRRGGFAFNGHTDFLAHLCNVPYVTMMLYNNKLRVSLVTTHLPLSEVPNQLSQDKIIEAVNQTVTHLQKWWKISVPRVGVCALNPHAGEGGGMGHEEISIIQPAISRLKKFWGNRAIIEGPLAADTLFAMNFQKPANLRHSAIVAMYHDQGLTAVKLLDFKHTVNITLGLPFVRTSVDHGTASDIAGKGVADSSSMETAILEAIKLSKGYVK